LVLKIKNVGVNDGIRFAFMDGMALDGLGFRLGGGGGNTFTRTPAEIRVVFWCFARDKTRRAAHEEGYR